MLPLQSFLVNARLVNAKMRPGGVYAASVPVKVRALLSIVGRGIIIALEKPCAYGGTLFVPVLFLFMRIRGRPTQGKDFSPGLHHFSPCINAFYARIRHFYASIKRWCVRISRLYTRVNSRYFMVIIKTVAIISLGIIESIISTHVGKFDTCVSKLDARASKPYPCASGGVSHWCVVACC